MVCKTVLLELEWVMRGYYGFNREDIRSVFKHILSLTHIQIENRPEVEQALDYYIAGLDLADALHHASYRQCRKVASFDDRKFVRRAKRLGAIPIPFVPK